VWYTLHSGEKKIRFYKITPFPGSWGNFVKFYFFLLQYVGKLQQNSTLLIVSSWIMDDVTHAKIDSSSFVEDWSWSSCSFCSGLSRVYLWILVMVPRWKQQEKKKDELFYHKKELELNLEGESEFVHFQVEFIHFQVEFVHFQVEFHTLSAWKKSNLKVNLFNLKVNSFNLKVNSFTFWIQIDKKVWAPMTFKNLFNITNQFGTVRNTNLIWIDLENHPKFANFFWFESCGSPNWSCHNPHQKMHFFGARRKILINII